MAINLEKGQKINLKKNNGDKLKKVYMGLGWEPAVKTFLGIPIGIGESIDLDASCVMMDSNNNIIETISFRNLRSSDRSIFHSGDNLTGQGDGDDEVIEVDLERVPSNVTKIVFTINSFRGQTFDKVKDCFSRLVDKTNNTEFCRYRLSESGNHTGMIMSKLEKVNNEWHMKAIGEPCIGRTVDQVFNKIKMVS